MSKQLQDIRVQIDSLDDQIHDLLMKRADLVLEIGKAKQKDNLEVVQPHREISVLRRLLNRHTGAFPEAAVIQIWREMVGALSMLQAGLSVAVTISEPNGEANYWELARQYFGSVVPMEISGNPLATLAKVRDGDATIAVLPWPVDGEEKPWWSYLIDETSSRPLRVVARLPLGNENPNNNPEFMALAVAKLTFNSSGADNSFIAIIARDAISRSKIIEKANELELNPLGFYATGGNGAEYTYLLEVGRYLGADDSLCQNLLRSIGVPEAKAISIGGYPVPPVYENNIIVKT